MKLVLFTHAFPYLPAETFLEAEIDYLAERFSEIVIVPSQRGEIKRPVPNNARVDDSLAEILESRTPSLVRRARSFLAHEPWKCLLSKPSSKILDFGVQRWIFAHWNVAGDIYRWMIQSSDVRPNSNTVYYSYWFGLATIALARFSKEQGQLNFVTRSHGGDLYEYRVHKGVFPFREYSLNEIHSVYPCSEDGREHLTQHYGAWKDKIKLARLGVHSAPENPWTPVRNTIRVCSCAYVTAIKRLSTLGEALELILQQNTDVHIRWTHFGDGPLLEELRIQAESGANSLEVDFHGSLANSEILKCYSQQPFDVFVNCSSSEGLPVSIMEALSFGIPVVAPDVGGVSELVNCENGWLVESECTPQQVADAIERVLAEPHARRAAARNFWGKYVNAEKNYSEFANQLFEIGGGQNDPDE